jgi:hypothetical protein
MTEKKQKDPVDKTKKEADARTVEDEVTGVDESVLEFKSVPSSAGGFVHPFDGYPYGPKITLETFDIRGTKQGEAKVCTTFIVAVSPSFIPNEDVSGRNVQIAEHKLGNVTTLSGTFKVMKPSGEMHSVSLGTYHSRMLVCYEPPYSGDNYDVVFDRLIRLPSGAERYCAVVPYHSLRAQLMFTMNWKDDPPTMMADKRYDFLDLNQRRPLRRLFQNVVSRNISREKMAAMVSGEVEASDTDLNKIQTDA